MITVTADHLNALARAAAKRPGNNAVVAGIVANAKLLSDAGISTTDRLSGFFAQACVETDYFATLEEYGGTAYFTKMYDKNGDARGKERAKNLGNTEAGDGARFHGRGIFQLTGRYNYTVFGKRLGIDLVKNPELAADPKVSVQLALLYWSDRNLSALADQKMFIAIGRAINRGNASSKNAANHEAERIRCTELGLKLFA